MSQENKTTYSLPRSKMVSIYIIAVLFLFATSAIYAIQQFIIMPGFLKLEQSEAGKDLSRCLEAFTREIHHLDVFCSDWAVWDETYKFVNDKNDAFLKSNIAWDALENNSGINLIAFYGMDGEMIWGEAQDTSKGGRIEVKEILDEYLGGGHYLLAHKTKESKSTGLVLTSQGPMFIISRPVLTNEGEGPFTAIMIMGRFINDEVLRSFSEQTKVVFDIKILGESYLSPMEEQQLALLSSKEHVFIETSQDILHGYAIIKDPEGAPALLITTTMPRDIMKRGQATSQIASVSILIALTLVALTVFIWFSLRLVENRRHTVRIEDLVKKRTAELKKSEERFDQVTEYGGMMIWETDTEGLYTYVSHASDIIWGSPPNELINEKRSQDLLPAREWEVPGNTGVANLAFHASYRDIEIATHTKNGRLIWVAINGSPLFDANGALLGYRGSDTDITGRKQAEEAIIKERAFADDIMNALPGIFYMYDDDWKLVRWNKKMEEATGFSSEELSGMHIQNFLPGTLWSSITLRSQSIFSGEEAYEEEIIQTKNGEQIPYFFSGRLTTFYGKQYIIGVGIDITSRKRAEDEKAKLEKQLQQSQKMESIGRLAGGVAHDFNNMLGVILAHVELAMDQINPASSLSFNLEEIRKASIRSADLTRQLLAFARKQTVAPIILYLNDTVTGMLMMLRRLLGEDIDLKWLPGKELWSVNMDPSQIDQILANLCVNARDAISDTGQIIIETSNITLNDDYCAVRVGFTPGEYVQLTVSDTGCGMDKETLTHIFEPFFTTKDINKGTGLGLATVYGAIKQNSGFINAYSEPEQGTTFTIYLPRHYDNTSETLTQVMAAPPARGQETILLVEDEVAILTPATLLLEKQGYTVLPAISPNEALRIFEEHTGKIHLLLTDVVMPQMNGKDLAIKLLSVYPQLKVLFMSGYTANVIAHHGVLDKGVHFIQKPFSLGSLAFKVREALDSGNDA